MQWNATQHCKTEAIHMHINMAGSQEYLSDSSKHILHHSLLLTVQKKAKLWGCKHGQYFPKDISGNTAKNNKGIFLSHETCRFPCLAYTMK